MSILPIKVNLLTKCLMCAKHFMLIITITPLTYPLREVLVVSTAYRKEKLKELKEFQ